MAPDGYFSGIKELCEDYGARFHNTGHMGGVWNDYLPALMRGADLPFSLEPGVISRKARPTEAEKRWLERRRGGNPQNPPGGGNGPPPTPVPPPDLPPPPTPK